MRINFKKSPQSTLGIEWELATIDLKTMEQAPAADIVLSQVDDPVDGPIRGEYLNSMIELVSGVHTTVSSATQEMAELLGFVLELLEPHGFTVLAIGSHPFSDPGAQQPRQKAQYRRVTERNAWWGSLMAINGLHIHTGVAERDKALPITYGMARFIPYFIALSASSPFWEGIDTRFASQRTMIFQQLPTNGLPYHMKSWDEYERYATELEGVGMIQNPSEIRWDIRPATWGTVENRAMDCVPTVMELGALAAMSQCLVEFMSREFDAGGTIDRLAYWFMRENKWRAARYGLDAEVITPRPWEHTLAEELGCPEELENCAELVRNGPSYVRQRRVYKKTRDMRAVVRSVVSETVNGRPNFSRKKESRV